MKKNNSGHMLYWEHTNKFEDNIKSTIELTIFIQHDLTIPNHYNINLVEWHYFYDDDIDGDLFSIDITIDNENIGIENIMKHEKELINYGQEILRKNNSVELIGNPKNKGAVLSFTIKGIHPHDIATILDEDGVAIRAGHHCCQILHEKLGLAATARASFGVYNNKNDIGQLNSSINKCKKIFNLK